MSEKTVYCDVMIIGTGMAGMAAAFFAVAAGLAVCQAGMTGELPHSSGLIDLMGMDPSIPGRRIDDPLQGIQALDHAIPSHPLTRLAVKDIDHGLDRFLDFLGSEGLSYYKESGKNQTVITSMGTTKPSYAVPESMMAGVRALDDQSHGLIVDIKNMKGFSARQITETLKSGWPSLSFRTIEFPGTRGEVFPDHLALALEDTGTLNRFADSIKPHMGESRVVGMPAILGLTPSDRIRNCLEERLGVPVFEIPGMPPSIPGLRLKHILETALPKKGVRLFSQKKVHKARRTTQDGFIFHLEDSPANPPIVVQSRAAILASGRFLGQGLAADYNRISETIFDLPVHQPPNRQQWHAIDFFDKNGHDINSAGIETDTLFRPVDPENQPLIDCLFAAGSVLAHNDWKRLKSGAGVSIASAFGAVKSYLILREFSRSFTENMQEVS